MNCDRLAEVVAAFDLVAVIVFGPDGREVCRRGDLGRIQKAGLFRTLLGGESEVDRLRESLTGQILPTIWSQGPLKTFVSKTKDGALFAAFSETTADPQALYRLSREVSNAIERALVHGV